jgi:hypothetical protein
MGKKTFFSLFVLSVFLVSSIMCKRQLSQPKQSTQQCCNLRLLCQILKIMTALKLEKGFKPWTSKKDRMINGTYHLPCLVNRFCSKNALGTGSASSGHITKLEQSTFSFDT